MNVTPEHVEFARTVYCRFRRDKPRRFDDDLYQQAQLGLLQAVKRYRPKSGASFETYARHHIVGTMLEFLAWEDPLKRGHRDLVKAGEAEFHRDSAMEPDAIPDRSRTPEEIVADREGLDRALAKLEARYQRTVPRYRQILWMRFALNMKLREIGEELGMGETAV